MPVKASIKITKLGGAYGKPWSKQAQVSVSPDTLKLLGREIVKAVKQEAKKDLRKQGGKPTPRGVPAGLPRGRKFLNSFKYKLVGRSTVKVVSNFPWVHLYVDGTTSFELSRQKRVNEKYIVPLKLQDGSVIFRPAPLKSEGYWIHPGYARHTFIRRGIEKGKQAAAKAAVKKFVQQLADGDPNR